MTYTFQPYAPPAILRGHLRLGGKNAGGGTIGVNSLYLERDGKPWLPVMGEYHFVRARRENWYRELCKMKAGGVDIVSTYLFWLCHEETPGAFDFSGGRDLRAFVLEARRAGLEVFLRPGPWVHGEARNGGFPDWITREPYRPRTLQPAFMERVRLLYAAYYEQVKDLFWEDGGPIIGFQLDNEISSAEYLGALRHMAEEIGFRVPLWTATGWGELFGTRIPLGEMLPLFGGYPEAPWDGRREELPPVVHYAFSPLRNDSMIGADLGTGYAPDGWRLPFERYPFGTCELGGGNQVTHHRRPVFSGEDIYALSLVKLGSGDNLIGYYMYHGGTNPLLSCGTMNESRATGYPNDCPAMSYDFQAPLSEFGEVRDSYRMLNLLHLFVRDFGDVLAPMPAVMSDPEVPAGDLTRLRYAMRTDGKGGFVFVSQYQRRYPVSDVTGAVIDTGRVTFPPIDVREGMSFLLPFDMALGHTTLTWATAQPVCREGNAFFFAALPGIPPRYRVGGEIYEAPAEEISVRAVGPILLVTLPMRDALYLRRLNGRLYVGDGCDLYSADGTLRAADGGDFSCRVWNGAGFDALSVRVPFTQAVLTAEDCAAPFDPPYPDELRIGGERPLRWKRLSVSSPDGFVDFTDDYDIAQLYVDGVLTADNYWTPAPWRLPAGMMYGRSCHIVMSGRRDDFFFEPV